MQSFSSTDFGAASSPLSTESKNAQFRWLIIATLLTVVLSLIPYADILVYPIRLFVTLIHESGHALATVLTFGDVKGLTVSPDESGLTWSQGGFRPLISSAGYLGSMLFGAGLLLLAQRESYARNLLYACGALVFGVTFFFVNGSASWLIFLILALAVTLWIAASRPGFGKIARFGLGGASLALVLMLIAFWTVTGTLFSWAVGLFLGTAFLVLGHICRPAMAHFLVNFLAVQCCLNALVDLKVLFLLSTTTLQHSDAVNMQQMTGIPAVFWAIVWGIMALGILILVLWMIQYRGSKAS